MRVRLSQSHVVSLCLPVLHAQMVHLQEQVVKLQGQLDAAMDAAYVRNLELLALAEREVLSPAEEVFAIPFLSERSVMSFLTQAEALPLRAASRACRDAVAEHAWSDFDKAGIKSCIKGSLASWRRCFPRATAANLSDGKLTDVDLLHLRGIRTLRLYACELISDAGLAHLSGIHTLYISWCRRVSISDCAFVLGQTESKCSPVGFTCLGRLDGGVRGERLRRARARPARTGALRVSICIFVLAKSK